MTDADGTQRVEHRPDGWNGVKPAAGYGLFDRALGRPTPRGSMRASAGAGRPIDKGVSTLRKVISRQEAAALVQDGMTLGMLGFVTLSVPEELLVSLEERFLAEGHPRDLNVFYTSAIGDGGEHGANHLAHGAGAAYGGRPCRSGSQAQPSDHGQPDRDLLRPSGVLVHMCRAMAGHKCGVITHVGLKTFCDRRWRHAASTTRPGKPTLRAGASSRALRSTAAGCSTTS